MPPEIRFCTASDGVRIAYTIAGEGVPLLYIPGWVSHLELNLENPVFQKRIAEANSRGIQFITYDKRGTGLSDRNLTDHSIEARLRDAEAVTEACGLGRFALWGFSEGGPIAMTYAAAQPERVTHLVLAATFAALRTSDRSSEVRDAMLRLVRAEWGLGSNALAGLMVPEANEETRAGFLRLQQLGATRKDAALMLEAVYATDVRAALGAIKAKTLVIHGRQDRAIPFECGREIGGTIRGARFMPHDGGHLQVLDDAWYQAIFDFMLDEDSAAAPARPQQQAAPSGLITIVFSDVTGSTTLTERLGDAAAREAMRAHDRITRDALAAHGGTEIKAMGDGFMASFQSASRALEWAIALQRAMEQHNETAAHPVHVHVGVNAGEPIAEEGDLYGTAVNMAARIASTAPGGEIAVSNVVRELVAGKGFEFADRGDTVLRGFEDPVRLYDLRWRA